MTFLRESYSSLPSALRYKITEFFIYNGFEWSMALTSREKFSLLLPREFLTRGKFRLLFLLSSSFLKKKEIDRNSAFNVSSNVFFPFRFVSTTSEPVCSLCSSSSAPSVRRWVSCSSFPPPPFPLSPHARTFTHRGKNLGRYVSSRNLPITPVHPTPPPVQLRRSQLYTIGRNTRWER